MAGPLGTQVVEAVDSQGRLADAPPAEEVQIVDKTAQLSAGIDAGLAAAQDHLITKPAETEFRALDLAARKFVQGQDFETAFRGTENTEDPVVLRAKDEFVRLQNARKQGAIPANDIRVRYESLFNELAAENPAFRDEFRRVGQEVIGRDPAGFSFSLLAQRAGQKQEKTEREKAAEKVGLELAAAAIKMVGLEKYNTNPEYYKEIARIRGNQELERQVRISEATLALKDRQNDGAAQLAVAEAEMGPHADSAMETMFMHMRQAQATGDHAALDPLALEAFPAMLEAQIQRTARNIGDSSARSTYVKGATVRVDAMRKMIASGNVNEFMNSKKMLENWFRDSEMRANSWAVAAVQDLGPGMGEALVDFARAIETSTTPAQREAIAIEDPISAAIFNNPVIMRGLGYRVAGMAARGEPAVGDVPKKMQAQFVDKVVHSPETSEEAKEAMLGLRNGMDFAGDGEAGQEHIAMYQYTNPKTAAQVRKSPKLAKQMNELASRKYNAAIAAAKRVLKPEQLEHISFSKSVVGLGGNRLRSREISIKEEHMRGARTRSEVMRGVEVKGVREVDGIDSARDVLNTLFANASRYERHGTLKINGEPVTMDTLEDMILADLTPEKPEENTITLSDTAADPE